MATADIRPIDDLAAGRILSGRTVVIGNLLTTTPLVLMFAGGGLAWYGGDLAFGEDAAAGADATLGWILLAVGAAVAAAAAYWGLRNTTKLGNWYLRRLARSEVRSRPDGLVDPDDPGAIFVEVVPRENWSRLMLETATDVGFLLVDEAAREVRFEGDRERARIPARAVESCEVEQTVFGEGMAGATQYFFTVLAVRAADGVREFPFAYRGDFGTLGANVRERRAADLRDRVLRLIGDRG